MRRAAPTLAALALLVSAAPAGAAQVQPGETLSHIALRTGVSVDELAAANGIEDADRIRAGDQITVPGTPGGGASARHVVVPGDSLFALSARYGVGVDELAAANGVGDRRLIVIGQVLTIPGASGGSSSGGSGGGGQGASTGSDGPVRPRGASDEQVRRLITAEARSYGWSPAVPLGLAMQESGWNNTVVSPDNARGIMQVLPATRNWVETFLVDRSLDLGAPADNVAAGMAYLDHLHRRYDGDVELALAAYYGGPGNVTGTEVPAFAERYVANVLALAERYR